MRFYIWVSFGSLCLGVLCQAVLMSAASYPRKRDSVSLGQDTVGLVVRIAFGVWAGLLLFGQ